MLARVDLRGSTDVRRALARPPIAGDDVEAHDRRGLVKDVSTLLAAEHINILAMETRTDRLTQSALITVTIEVEGLAVLSRILHRLANLPNVTSVRRVT
jgi:GTP pyrophosphokinase